MLECRKLRIPVKYSNFLPMHNICGAHGSRVIWSTVLSLGDPNGISGCWVEPVPKLAVVGIWRLKQQTEIFSLSDTCTHIHTHMHFAFTLPSLFFPTKFIYRLFLNEKVIYALFKCIILLLCYISVHNIIFTSRQMLSISLRYKVIISARQRE